MPNAPRKVPNFFLSLYGWTYWLPILLAGALGIATCLFIPGLLWLAMVFAVVTFAGLAFFRDFPRKIPIEPGIMVAPADGKVTEITRLDYYEPFDGPALKVGIFLSVLDVHVNRSPCHGVVLWTRYEEGLFLDARHPESGARNQSNTLCLAAPSAPASPAVVVRQVVGAIARRIIAPVVPGESLARGERFGMIAFGSRTELYVRAPESWKPAVRIGQHVRGGRDTLLRPV
jgi:phosphatidylserine decarboxylase